MYDIDFFKKTNNLKKKITSGLLKSADIEDIGIELESLRKIWLWSLHTYVLLYVSEVTLDPK